MHSHLNRRSFLLATAAVGTAATLPAVHSFAATNPLGPNDDISVGIIGSGGRANELFGTIKGVKGVKVVAVADPEEGRAGNLAKKADAKAYQDLRKIIDDPSIHAVFVATCNHWHCLAAVMAIQAGKDVYVEKATVAHSVGRPTGHQSCSQVRSYGPSRNSTTLRPDASRTEAVPACGSIFGQDQIRSSQSSRGSWCHWQTQHAAGDPKEREL